MEHIDVLLTIAEISVAVAGFAALATVIGQSRRHTDPQVNAIRLRGLMNVALATMFLALIPAAMLRAPSLEPWAWHLSSVAGLLISVIVGWGALKRDRPRRHLPGYSKPVAAANYTILAIVCIAFAVNSSGLAGSLSGFVYQSTLILMLAGASTLFVLVIISLLSAEADTPSQPPK